MRDSGSPASLAARNTRDRVSAVLSYAVLIGGIVTIGVSVYLVVLTYSSLPYVDGWDEVGAAAHGSSQLDPAWLWPQHSEHRLVVSKLFLAADLRFFRAQQIFLLVSIFLIQFLHWLLLGWSMRALGGWRGAVWRTGLGLAAFCLFCPTQWENFVWGFQVCFVLPGLFASLSFIALLVYWNDSCLPRLRHSWTPLLVANLAALAASYSLANGNLLWPILIAAAILLRLRLQALLSFVITGAISTTLYLTHYIRPPWHANPLSSIATPVKLAEYWTGYLGSPWFRWGLHLAAPLGLAALLAALAVVLGFRYYMRTHRAFAIQLALTLLFCAGTAFITALGRLNFGPQQSFASRYQTIALLFWCCFGLMALLFAAESYRARNLLIAFQICLLLVMARGAVRAHFPIENARLHGFRLHQVTTSLLTGVDDDENFLLALGQTPGQIEPQVRYLRRKRLSVFSSEAYRQLDMPLKSVFTIVAPQQCRGRLESATPLSSAQSLAISGWAWDDQHQRPPLRIVVTANGVITGLAAVGAERAEVRAADPGVRSDFTGFAGYVRDAWPSTPLKIYAVLSEDPPVACYVAALNSPAGP